MSESTMSQAQIDAMMANVSTTPAPTAPADPVPVAEAPVPAPAVARVQVVARAPVPEQVRAAPSVQAAIAPAIAPSSPNGPARRTPPQPDAMPDLKRQFDELAARIAHLEAAARAPQPGLAELSGLRRTVESIEMRVRELEDRIPAPRSRNTIPSRDPIWSPQTFLRERGVRV